jgi:hypothetical protein
MIQLNGVGGFVGGLVIWRFGGSLGGMGMLIVGVREKCPMQGVCKRQQWGCGDGGKGGL